MKVFFKNGELLELILRLVQGSSFGTQGEDPQNRVGGTWQGKIDERKAGGDLSCSQAPSFFPQVLTASGHYINQLRAS